MQRPVAKKKRLSSLSEGRLPAAALGESGARPRVRSTHDGLPADRFVNRELAWLAFNERVLEEALDPNVPLLERLKFLSIVSSNLDEFFMVRVAGLKRLIDAGIDTPFFDGLTPVQCYRAVASRCRELVTSQHRAFASDLRPSLERAGVRILELAALSPEQREHLRELFRRTILPVVTPLALDPGHPFPYLLNRTLCLVVTLRSSGGQATAFIHVPSTVLPRFVRLPAPAGRHEFVLLEDVVRGHLDQLFHGYEVVSCSSIRVTRDWDLVIDEESAGDLLKSIEEGIRARRQGLAVRLQHDVSLPKATLEVLQRELALEPDDLYGFEGMLAFSDLLDIYNSVELPQHKEPPLPPQRVPALDRSSTFDALRKGDVLVHHPYQSFDYVTRFLREAADDPNVLAIKTTLYRTGGGISPIVEALFRAARNGKQVAVLMELKARFDEQANIEGARRLEQAGAHVIYGLVGLKTHVKACLVVRREEDEIRRYVHLSTGNYDPRTAEVYCDYGLFTAHEGFCEDVTELFNVVTGYCRPLKLQHIALAPYGLRERLLDLVLREREHAKAGRPSRIVLQTNGIVDPELVDELYLASRAGTKIDLIVRGICCLRPGVPGLSETVRAIRIVDRFLEHARAFMFANGGETEVYLSSGDWMPRNLDRRVEALFPVLDPALRNEIASRLELQLRDDVKASVLDRDVRGTRAPRTGTPVRSQLELWALANRLARG
ncbi:MAG TPA: polyphosphate kinase 1 [Planctomycetota bacterium]|nr:polyphosphate kinase 1 [Planctomycetota bacterium]